MVGEVTIDRICFSLIENVRLISGIKTSRSSKDQNVAPFIANKNRIKKMNSTTSRVDTAEIIISELMITVITEIMEYPLDIEAFDERVSDMTPNANPNPLIAIAESDFTTQDIPVNETAREISVMINAVMESISLTFEFFPEMSSPSLCHCSAGSNSEAGNLTQSTLIVFIASTCLDRIYFSILK